jgi:hypothetical protein
MRPVTVTFHEHLRMIQHQTPRYVYARTQLLRYERSHPTAPWLAPEAVNRYLPSNSRSPNSRTPTLGTNGQIWGEVARDLGRWRCIWTSSGVSDTKIYVKPGMQSVA